MTIRIKEEDVPTELRPARLFLNDVEDVVSILRELAATGEAKDGNHDVHVLFSIGNRECDSVAEIPKLHQRNRRIHIVVSMGWDSTRIGFHPLFGTSWTSFGYTKDAAWSAFHKLDSVLRTRTPPFWRRYIPLLGRGSSVVCRNSWEPSPFIGYVKDKIAPIVVSATLGIMATLLGMYLKHKYWP